MKEPQLKDHLTSEIMELTITFLCNWIEMKYIGKVLENQLLNFNVMNFEEIC